MDWIYLFSTSKHDRLFGEGNNCVLPGLTLHPWVSVQNTEKNVKNKKSSWWSWPAHFLFLLSQLNKYETCSPLTDLSVDSLPLPLIPFSNIPNHKTLPHSPFSKYDLYIQGILPLVIPSKLRLTIWILTHNLPAFLIYTLPDSRPLGT